MTSSTGIAGGLVLAVDSFRPALVPRSTNHQALLFGASAAIGFGAGAALRRGLWTAGLRHPLLTHSSSRVGLFAAAVAATGPLIARRSRQERAAHADWGVEPMDPARAIASGSAVAATLIAGTKAVGRAARTAGDAAAGRFGGPAALWYAGVVAGSAGVALLVDPYVERALFTVLARAGTRPDPAFTEPPDNPFVSGGPGSGVNYETLAREGFRFAHLASTPSTIAAVTGRAATAPIRVFVGVASAPTPEERVALAVAELDRLRAFERRAILAVSPAGTGYANPVPIESLELLTGGDCATVVVQYGVLPSMFSAGAVPDGAATYRLLVDALVGRGPQVFCYGESLGAQAAQLALQETPTLVGEDGGLRGVDAALFVGTPAGTGLRGLAGQPRVLLADRWQDLPVPAPRDVSLWLLDHFADPVTRFERPLIWKRPDWLAEHPRGRGIPEQMAWRPLLTWLQVLFDVARATQPQLGTFQSHGHDYRADLAPLVRAAFAPDASDDLLAAVQDALVRSELRRAELLALPAAGSGSSAGG